MLILGIDPGYDRCGWGVIEKNRGTISYVACGLIQTKKTDPASKRLGQIANELYQILQRYKPEAVGIEKLFFFKNKITVIGVAEARGSILSTIANWSDKIELQEFTPMQIKLAVTGSGAADKKAVEKMLRLQLKDIPEKLIDDTLDALGVALTVNS